MTDPTPITLPEGEALYRAGDLPDEGWEARNVHHDGGARWSHPKDFSEGDFGDPAQVVVARRKRWVPQVGDRVRMTHYQGELLAIHEPSQRAWVMRDFDGPTTYALSDLSPEVSS